MGCLHQCSDGGAAECNEKLLKPGTVGRVGGGGEELVVGVDVDGPVYEDANCGGREDLHPAADRPLASS